jgi:hypothetical protein
MALSPVLSLSDLLTMHDAILTDDMSSEQRRSEVCAILAAGCRRLFQQGQTHRKKYL